MVQMITLSCVRRLCHSGFRGMRGYLWWNGRKELADALRELGSIAGPIADAVTLEEDGGRLGAWVVGPDDFDGTAITGAILFDNHDAIVGLLTCADARQTNHQQGEAPKKVLKILGEAGDPVGGRSTRHGGLGTQPNLVSMRER